MVIAPTKVHPLWYTPILSLLFLLSAISVGFPMVIVESVFASWSLKLPVERDLLSSLARLIPVILGVYLAFRMGDLFIRGAHVDLADGSVQSIAFLIEVGIGGFLPLGLLLSRRIRESTRGLLISALLVVFGVVMNRVDVFLIAYRPPYAVKNYFPSLGEVAVTIGLIATLMLVYRVVVTFFGVISQAVKARTPAQRSPMGGV